MPPPPFTLPAYAKINLALSVGPPLPAADAHAGFHPIASWMVAIDLADEVRINPLAHNQSSRYSITPAPDAPKPSPIDWPLEKDLAVRAHKLLEHEAGRALPISLEIAKRIPVGGGLGGGSSDAAAALLAIRAAFNLDIPHRHLIELAATLGSDVPFFLDETRLDALDATPRSAIVTGLGDKIERIATPRQSILLIIPPFGCPTGPVYRAYDAAGPKPLREADIRNLVKRANSENRIPAAALFNDLSEPAGAVEPRLAALLATLKIARIGPAHITGSGSTVVLYADEDPARIRALLPGVAVVRANTL